MPDDPLRFIDAVTREVLTGERNSQLTRALIMRTRFDTSPAELWEAVTNPTRLARWFLPVSGDLRVEGHYQIEGNASGQITTCDPPRDFSLTWDWDAQRSWLAISLSPTSPGTWLRLEHVEPMSVGAPDEYGPGAGGVGWDQALLALAQYLAGATTDRADAATWLASPEGHRFIRASSDAWCVASIAAGADETAARRAAARTTAAYTAVPPATSE